MPTTVRCSRNRATCSGVVTAAGQAVAEEVVEPVGAEPGQGLLQERIDRVVVELLGLEAHLGQGPDEVGPVEELGLEPLVVVLLLRGEDEVDRVRERRVRDVVQEPGHPLAAVGPQPAQEEVDPQAVLEPGDRLEREGQGRRARLADPPEPPERRALDQREDAGIVDRRPRRKPGRSNASTPSPRALRRRIRPLR